MKYLLYTLLGAFFALDALLIIAVLQWDDF